MKRHSDKSIIPKIVLILGTLSILGIILLFIRPRPTAPIRTKRPETLDKLFTQVITAAKSQILVLWEEGDRFIKKSGVNCPEEILHDQSVGRSYYQCNPHFWQCFWQGGIKTNPELEIDLFGQTFHIVARPSFPMIEALSKVPRTYEAFRETSTQLNVSHGYVVELEVKEIPGFVQPLLLTDTCRDTYLPQRIYGLGKTSDARDEGFIWDNFERQIFIDRFYVTNRQVNEWRILKKEYNKLQLDRKSWYAPALLSLKEQRDYCHFFGKRLLEAKLFDAASMAPADLNNPLPAKVSRPSTPWQRDLSKTFFGVARINPDYQLTPLDCQLAQVQGCPEKFFTTDSSSWMGMNYLLGFYSESVLNFFEPDKNLKVSSRFHDPGSHWHELGVYGNWEGEQRKDLPVAFRCYEEVVK